MFDSGYTMETADTDARDVSNRAFSRAVARVETYIGGGKQNLIACMPLIIASMQEESRIFRTVFKEFSKYEREYERNYRNRNG